MEVVPDHVSVVVQYVGLPVPRAHYHLLPTVPEHVQFGHGE